MDINGHLSVNLNHLTGQLNLTGHLSLYCQNILYILLLLSSDIKGLVNTREITLKTMLCCSMRLHLQCLFLDVADTSAVGMVLAVNPSQEVHFDCVLGQSVLELIKKLATCAEGHILLV